MFGGGTPKLKTAAAPWPAVRVLIAALVLSGLAAVPAAAAEDCTSKDPATCGVEHLVECLLGDNSPGYCLERFPPFSIYPTNDGQLVPTTSMPLEIFVPTKPASGDGYTICISLGFNGCN